MKVQLMADSSPESAPHLRDCSTLGEKHDPTLLTLWVLIYFHIKPLPRYLTGKVSNITSQCQQTDSCVSWHQRSEAGQYCAVWRCDAVSCRDSCGLVWWAWPGHRASSWVINHWDDRNSGLVFMRHTQTTHIVYVHTTHQPVTHTQSHFALYT